MLSGQTDVFLKQPLQNFFFFFFFPQYTFSFNTTLSVSLRVNSWVETLCILERRKVVNNTVELKIALIYNDSL